MLRFSRGIVLSADRGFNLWMTRPKNGLLRTSQSSNAASLKPLLTFRLDEWDCPLSALALHVPLGEVTRAAFAVETNDPEVVVELRGDVVGAALHDDER